MPALDINDVAVSAHAFGNARVRSLGVRGMGDDRDNGERGKERDFHDHGENPSQV